MKQHVEIYIITDQLLPENWDKLYKTLLSYLGAFSKFEITFRCTDNVVRFFISSDKDLSAISNSIEGLLLRPVDAKELKLPETSDKERFMQFVTGGNLLDLKEKIAVKKTKDLQYAVFNIRAVNAEKAVVRSSLYLKNAGGGWSKANKLTSFFPSTLLSIDFATNTRYLKKTVPKYLDIEKSLHMLVSDNIDALFEIDTFPYFSHSYYLNIGSYEFDKHSFIIGASGSGKSKLIALMVDRLQRTQLKLNYRVIIVDPHDALAPDIQHIPNNKVINFNSNSTELFSDATADISAATELTATLFRSLLEDQFNARLDRLLRYSLFVLMTAQTMSLENLKRLLVEVEYRNQIIGHVEGFVPNNVIKFFGADYNEMRTQYYNQTILPIVSLIDEMQLQPSLMGGNEQSLAKTIQENFLTVFSLNKVSMGEKVVKTVAGLLIQQIFLMAQARVFNQKVILIIDEVSVVQNPALSQILAEARKFNLTVILSQQYFGQIEKDLRDAIFANVFNYYVFKVSEEDARALESNLNINLPKEIAEEGNKTGLKESDIRVKMLTELHPRECLVRLVSRGQVTPAVKARTMEASTAEPNPHAKKEKALSPVLPEKFVEGSQVASQPIKFSKNFIETLANNTNNTTPEVHSHQPAKRNIGSLRELLARHSSSRDKVNKERNDND